MDRPYSCTSRIETNKGNGGKNKQRGGGGGRGCKYIWRARSLELAIFYTRMEKFRVEWYILCPVVIEGNAKHLQFVCCLLSEKLSCEVHSKLRLFTAQQDVCAFVSWTGNRTA